MKNTKTIITIIITSVITSTITCACVFIINNHNNNDFIEESISILSTSQMQRDIATKETTAETTEEKSTVETATTTAQNISTTAAETTATTTESSSKTTATATTSSITKPTKESNTEQTLKEFEPPKKVEHPSKIDSEYEYIMYNNVFHKINCKTGNELFKNHSNDDENIYDFITVPYNTEQMIELGYIPCEECIKL